MGIKQIFKSVLSNNISGSVISLLFRKGIPDLRWPSYRYVTLGKGIKHALKSDIFFGFYEAAEIRMIHRFYSGKYDTIEFGSSMGIVSSHLVSLISEGRKLIGVEANPVLIEVLKLNVERHKKGNSVFIAVNRAIGYKSADVLLQTTSNTTETRVSAGVDSGIGGTVVPTMKLKDILEIYGIGDYTLVCDIEGTELDLLQFDAKAFERCQELIIELHQVDDGLKVWSVDDLRDLIEKKTGMFLRGMDGPVIFFAR